MDNFPFVGQTTEGFEANLNQEFPGFDLPEKIKKVEEVESALLVISKTLPCLSLGNGFYKVLRELVFRQADKNKISYPVWNGILKTKEGQSVKAFLSITGSLYYCPE